MLKNVRDFLDTSVSMIILMDDIEQLSILSEVIVSIGRERCTYVIEHCVINTSKYNAWKQNAFYLLYYANIE